MERRSGRRNPLTFAPQLKVSLRRGCINRGAPELTREIVGAALCRRCCARSAATETDAGSGVALCGAVSTHCFAGEPSVVSFAHSVGATLIRYLPGDGEMGDHGRLPLRWSCA